MIKRLYLNDIVEIEPLLKRFHTEMDYDEVGQYFDIGTIKESFNRHDMVCLAEVEAEPVGVLIFFIVDGFMGKGLSAVEVVWHSDPLLGRLKRAKVMISLLKAGQEYLRSRNVRFFRICTSVRYPAVARMLRRQGFILQELFFVKEV